jgi:hypothetical protein
MAKKSLFFGSVLGITALLLFSGCPTDSDEETADKTALIAAIEAADQAAAVQAATAAADVPSAEKWVTQDEKTAYTTAIGTARGVAYKDASQDEIDKALAALNEATKTFNAAKKDGTGVNKAELNAAISAAEEAVEAICVDTAAANVPSAYEWVTQTVKDAYQTAITAAKTTANKTDASQSEIDNALTALNTATATFTTAKKAGTKAVSREDLTGAISDAEAAAAEVKVDTDGSKTSLVYKWVTQAEKDTYTGAIAAAKTTADKADASQTEIDNALTALLQAGDTFEAAKKDGTQVPVNKDGLSAAIAAAEAAVAAIEVNTNAANVALGREWVSADVKSAYETAITTAKTAAAREDARQLDIDRALAALNTATGTFNDARQLGITKPVVPEIVFDTTVVLYHGTEPLSRERKVELSLNSSYEVHLAEGYGYTNIHWYINGVKQGFPDTLSTLQLPTYKAGTLTVAVEATSNGLVDTSGNYTFEVK